MIENIDADFAVGYSSLAPVSPYAILQTALRHNYRGVLEIFARMSSFGDLSYSELLEFIESDERLERKWNYRAMLSLASWIAVKEDNLENVAFERALAIFDFVEESGMKLPNSFYARLVANLNLFMGRPEKALKIEKQLDRNSPELKWEIRLFSNHPDFHTGPETWIRHLNWPIRNTSLAPFEFKSKANLGFDSLTVSQKAAKPRSVPGPLISVIMTVFEPTDALEFAVDSIINQTWQNLELIVVDDANPAEDTNLIRQICSKDERIKYVRVDENQGTYYGRNLGLQLASGEYITLQDSDDWSHPQRLETQFRALEADPTAVANWCFALKLTDDLWLSRIGRESYSQYPGSIFFKRDLVLNSIGDFDPVRKSADSEFVQRIKVKFGKESVNMLALPLYLHRVGHESLSNSDFGVGWWEFGRWAYRSSYANWHLKNSTKIEPRLGKKSFWAPAEYTRTPMQSFEYAILGEIHDPFGPLAAAELSKSHEVALLQQESLWRANPTRRFIDSSVWSAQEKNHFQLASLDHNVHTQTLIVTEPELLNWQQTLKDDHLKAEKIITIANRGPWDRFGEIASFQPELINKYCENVFGVTPIWMPRTVGIQRQLVAYGCEVTDPELAVSSPVAKRPPKLSPNGITVGFWGAVEPSVTAALKQYGFDVRVLAGHLGGPTDINAQRIIDNSLTRFLDQIDIFVDSNPVAPSAILWHAAARGVVCLAHQNLEIDQNSPFARLGILDVTTQINALSHDLPELRMQHWKWARDSLHPTNFTSGIKAAERLGQ